MPNCCINCFKDEYIIELITEHGNEDTCDYCNSADVKCVDVSYLNDDFQVFTTLYEETAYGEHYMPEDDPADCGELLCNLIENDWNIFSELLKMEQQQQLLFDILDLRDSETLFSRREESFTYVGNEELWMDFCYKIKHSNRFFFDHHNWKEEISTVVDLLQEEVAINTIFYRARLGSLCDNGRNIPYPCDEMGAPPTEKTKNGRGNPAGISYLYLATNPKTAISEVRPWKSAQVSVATVEAIEDLTIINLTNAERLETPFGHKNLINAIECTNLIYMLSLDLSKPIDPNLTDYEYVPTQYITELIKHLGYDGIKFKSALGDEHNYIIFDSAKINITNVKIYTVNNVNYSFEAATK